jgi:hypothetical protein
VPTRLKSERFGRCRRGPEVYLTNFAKQYAQARGRPGRYFEGMLCLNTPPVALVTSLRVSLSSDLPIRPVATSCGVPAPASKSWPASNFATHTHRRDEQRRSLARVHEHDIGNGDATGNGSCCVGPPVAPPVGSIWATARTTSSLPATRAGRRQDGGGSFRENTMTIYQWMVSKLERSARRRDQNDVMTWLVIGAVFLCTLLLVSLPLLVQALHHA